MERQKQNFTPLAREARVYHEVISDMSIPVCCFNPDGQIVFKNQSFLNICGAPDSANLDNLNFFDILGPGHHQAIRTTLEQLTPESPFNTCEHSFIGPDGLAHWYICKNQAIFDNNQQVVQYRYIGHDFSQHHQETEKLKQMSLRDELTGLYNRYFVVEELKRLDSELNPENGIKYLPRERKIKPYSIIFGDVNDFKIINDTLGHDYGDQILKKASHIIRKNCRDYDVVSRWGGDEFLILLPDTTIKKAMTVKERIFKSCQEKNICIAMGVVQKGLLDDYNSVIQKADQQMYQEKEKLKMCYTK